MHLIADKVIAWNDPAAPAGITTEKVYLGPDPFGLGGFQVFVGLEGSAQELGIGARNMWAFSSPHLEDDLREYMASLQYQPRYHPILNDVFR